MQSDLKIDNGELLIENNDFQKQDIIDSEYQYLKNMFLYPMGQFRYLGKDLGYLHLFSNVNQNDPNSFQIQQEDIQKFLEFRNKYYEVDGFVSDQKKVFQFTSMRSTITHQLVIEE